MKTFKKTFSFIDKENRRAKITAEITKCNGYLEFTASGNYCNDCGQIQDDIKPRTPEQFAFVELWNNWHLNGINAGTKEQEKAIKKWQAAGNKYDYTKAKDYLRSINLYEVKHPKTGDPYKYGHGHIINELPADFDLKLINIIQKIEEENEKYKKVKEEEAKTEDDKIIEEMEQCGIDDLMFDACKAYLSNFLGDNMDLSNFEESYAGEFSSDEEFAENMAEDIGAINEDAQWPNYCIDWQRAARDLMQDYYEIDGYYFRSI